MRRCRFCRSVIPGRGVEAVQEHMVTCEEAVARFNEEGGEFDVIGEVERVVEVVPDKPKQEPKKREFDDGF